MQTLEKEGKKTVKVSSRGVEGSTISLPEKILERR
jgi:hypothetical protein